MKKYLRFSPPHSFTPPQEHIMR